MAVAALPTELVARAAADRADAVARRDAIRRIRRDMEKRKRQARATGNSELLTELDAFARRFEAAMRPSGSLDRFGS